MSRPDLLRLHAAMVIEDIPCKTIQFLLLAYDLLVKWDKGCTRLELAEAYGCSPQAAAKHIRKLVACGYLERVHYRAWALRETKIEQIIRTSEGG